MKSDRRRFIKTVSTTIGAAALGVVPTGMQAAPQHALTIQEVIDLIIAAIPGGPLTETVDTFKSGDPSQVVTGITTTFLATTNVINRTIELGANLILTHEPTYYNHLDEVDWLQDDPVYRHKRDLLDRHNIAVWRFHDYWHRHRPDGVLAGALQDLGWEAYATTDRPNLCVIPSMSLMDLSRHLKNSFGVHREVQVIGDPNLTYSRVGLRLGASGGRSHLAMLRQPDVEVLVVGEINEWETSVYVEDAMTAGMKKALIIIGHANSEETGMRWLVDWLRPRVPGIEVTHVPSGDPFTMV